MGYFWSGKHGRAVKGVCLVTLLHTDARGVRLPVNWRVVDKAEARTKNEHFREMVEEVLAWGLRPAWVSADSWYGGVENLKFLRDQGLGFLVGLEKNRTLSAREHEYQGVGEMGVPAAGRVLHLRGFGFVSVFRSVDKNNDVRHYSAFEPPKKSPRRKLPRARFEALHAQHWAIECYHRALKGTADLIVGRGGKGPSAITSSVRCAPSSTSNKLSGQASCGVGMTSSATSSTKP